MAFAIRKIQKSDLDKFYPEREAEHLGKFIHRKEKFPIESMCSGNVAVDEENGMYLIHLPLQHRDDHMWKYLFVCKEGVAVLKKEGYCKFSFVYISVGLNPKRSYLEQSVAGAFRCAGIMVDGTTDPNDCDSVPNAQFISAGDLSGYCG